MKRRRAVIFPPSIATSKNHSLRRGTSLGASFGGKKPRLLPQRSRACVPRASRKQETRPFGRGRSKGMGKLGRLNRSSSRSQPRPPRGFIAPRSSASTRRLFLFSGSAKNVAASDPIRRHLHFRERKKRKRGCKGRAARRLEDEKSTREAREVDASSTAAAAAAAVPIERRAPRAPWLLFPSPLRIPREG